MDHNKKEVTLSDLKELIGGIVQQAISTSDTGFIKTADLKELVTEEMRPLIQEETQAMKNAFQAEIEKLAKLPGEGGAGDIDPDDQKKVGLAKHGGYDCLSEFAKDVFLAGQQGAEPSPRFGKWMNDIKAYNTAMKAAGSPTLEVGDPELGGFLTPEEFSKTILDKGFSNSNFMDKCTKVPMAINQIGIPYQKDFDHSSYLHGAMQAYWLDEKAEKIATNPKFGKIALRLNKLVVLVYTTDELLEDSVISMEPLLKGKASDVIGWKIDQALMTGDGVGKPKGILNAKCKVTQGKGSTGATDIDYENIVGMYARMYPQCLKNAVWVANMNCFPSLAQMGLEVGTSGGSAAYLPANGLSGKPYDTLMGKPIIWSEHAKTVGTEGDIIFVDWSQYLVGLKRGAGAGVQFASSIHLKFDYDQTAFRFVMRIDGQPWWPAPFTPNNGADLSPIVTLETRT